MMCVCVSIEMSPYQKVSSCVALTVMLHLLHSTAPIVTLEILGIPLGLLAEGVNLSQELFKDEKQRHAF